MPHALLFCILIAVPFALLFLHLLLFHSPECPVNRKLSALIWVPRIHVSGVGAMEQSKCRAFFSVLEKALSVFPCLFLMFIFIFYSSCSFLSFFMSFGSSVFRMILVIVRHHRWLPLRNQNVWSGKQPRIKVCCRGTYSALYAPFRCTSDVSEPYSLYPVLCSLVHMFLFHISTCMCSVCFCCSCHQS